MPANIFYWREFYKSINVTAGSTGNDFLVLNQNDYYMSFACFVDMWFLDTNYPTAAFCRRYGLTGHTHLGLSSLNSRLTQYLDMGEWNTGSSEISSGSASVWLTKTTSKSAGSNNGHCRIQWNTGSYSQGSMTVRLTGMFLNTRVDAQDITANI